MKQLFTFLLGILCPVVIWSQDYVIEDGVLTSWINTPEEITIPSEATSIAPNVFQGNSTIRIVNTNSVTEVGQFAFDNCSNLEEVYMPNVTIMGQRAFRNDHMLGIIDMPKIESIGQVAFHACNELTEITFPATLTSFGIGALSNCANLSSIIVDDGNTSFESDGGVLYNKSRTTLYAYANGLTATSFNIPNTVTRIGGLAFYNVDVLTSITLPTVTTLDERAFTQCSNLTSIDLPEVTSIGSQAFEYCTKLTSVSFPKVNSLGWSAFKNCKLITGIMNLPDGLTTYGSSAFSGTAINAFTISADNAAFSVVDDVLFNKSQTRLVAYPPAKTASSYTVPDNVETIAANAFYDCNTLVSIDATTSSLTTLGGSSFYSCGNLETLTLSSNITTIGSYAFSECPKLTNISFVGADPNYVVEDGIIYNQNKTKLILYPKSKTDASFTIPETVVEIGNSAFYSCTSLTSVTMPNVVTIGSNAFQNCTYIETVSMPEVTTINNYAFYSCTKLSSVDMPKVEKIYTAAFYNCRLLESLELPSIKSIYTNAFQLCSGLTNVDASLASNLTYIGTKSFELENSLLTVNVATSAIKSYFPAEIYRNYTVNVKTYHISVNALTLNGVVNATYNGEPFTDGELEINQQVEITATPDHNYIVDKWTINEATIAGNTQTNWTYTVNTDAAIAVAFTEKPDDEQSYTLDYNVIDNTGGSLNCTVDETAVTSGSLVIYGKETTLTANPAEGYRVKCWYINDVMVSNNSSNTLTYIIPKSNSEVTVEFEVATFPITYSVVVEDSEDNPGTLIAEVDEQLVLSGNEVTYGKDIVFTATPDVGYKVKQWIIDDVIQSEYAKTITISNYAEESVVTVEFERKTYLTTYAVDGTGGTLNATVNDVNFYSGDWITHGSSLEFIATPAAGYRVKKWMLNDEEQFGFENTLTVDLVTEELTVSVQYETIPQYALTYNINNTQSGTIEAIVSSNPISSGSSLYEDTQIDLVVTPETGYEVTKWQVNGVEISATNNYSITISENVTVEVTLSLISYNLTYIAGDYGSIEGSVSQSVFYGNAGTEVTAVADNGYHFVQWSDGLTDATRTDINITSNIEVTAEFAVTTDIDTETAIDISVFPNPCVNQIHIKNASEINHYQLINTVGQIELDGTNEGNSEIIISVSSVKSGIYVLLVKNESGQAETFKIVKQ